MASFAQRLKELRQARGLRQRELSGALDIPRNTIASWETGRRFPEVSAAQRLADFFGVTLDYLLGRSDASPAAAEAFTRYLPQAGERDRTVLVPVVGVIRAGEPILAAQSLEGHVRLPASDVPGGEHFFLRVRGDSMVGARIHEGDLVLVRRQPEVDDGDIAVVLIDDEEATIKRVYRLDGKWLLKPENPGMPPLVLPRRAVRIIGKVVRVQFDV